MRSKIHCFLHPQGVNNGKIRVQCNEDRGVPLVIEVELDYPVLKKGEDSFIVFQCHIVCCKRVTKWATPPRGCSGEWTQCFGGCCQLERIKKEELQENVSAQNIVF